METKFIETKVGKILGISAGVIALASLAFFASNIYRNYVGIKRDLLEIEKLKRELNK